MARPFARTATAALLLNVMSAGCMPQAGDGTSSPQPPSSSGTGGKAASAGSGGRTNGGSGGTSSAPGGSGGNTASGGTGGAHHGEGGASGGGGSGGSGQPSGSGGSGSGGRAGGSGGSGGAGPGDAAPPADMAPSSSAPKLSTDVLPIVKAKCAAAGCHDPVKREHGMNLSTADLIHMAWVNAKTNDHCMRNASVTRVTPGKPETSFVVTLIKNDATRCAEQRRMPPAPVPPLSAAEVKTISDWIAAGALKD